MIVLTDLSPGEIAQALALKPYQGAQIFRWLHIKKTFDFEQMTDLSKALRQRLRQEALPRQLELANVVETRATGARKALFRLRDGQTVESVLLRDRERVTLCLSCQVGCAVRCAFCATGQSGFVRNLQPGEIVEQALLLLKDYDIGDRSPNIVYMGMGEPFHNYDSVRKSVQLLMAPEGVNIGARRITVSTVGDVPGIRRFAEEDWQVRLAVSLHAANDALRDELVPLNKKYPLDKLMEAVRQYTLKTGRQASVEYVLLHGVNDSVEHARQLAARVAGMDVTVNLIPYNAVPGAKFQVPAPKTCETFRDALTQKGVRVTLRTERGQDIDAACGQLRLRNL